jgi:hypothetical protein
VRVFIGFVFGFWEREGEEKSRGTNASSAPTSRVQGKKKTYSAVQNGTVLGLFFLTVDETAPFWIKRAVLF